MAAMFHLRLSEVPPNIHDLKDKFAPNQSFLRVKHFKELSIPPLPLDHLDKKIASDDLVENRGAWLAYIHRSCF